MRITKKTDFSSANSFSIFYRAEIDVETLTRFRLHSIMLSFDPEVFPSNKTNLVQIEQQLMEHFLYGLATAKGQKLIQKYKHQRTKTLVR